MAQTIKTSKKVMRKLSIAVGLLSFAAFVIQGLSTTWGFDAVGYQITQTCLLFSGAINIYFAGSTTQKEITEREDDK
jgi:small neutral amino acid transporter SnatA (MarC family)